MSVLGKLGGISAGLAIGGPIGALIGVAAGHYLVDKYINYAQTELITPPEKTIAFTIGVIALSAKMAKADGIVTKDEIDAFKRYFLFSAKEAKNVERIFNIAQTDIAGYDAYARQLARLFKNRKEILLDIIDILFCIAKADKVIHSNELAYIKSIAQIFNITRTEFLKIEGRHKPLNIRDPYLILGVAKETSINEIKNKYRQLVSQNHPDKLIAKGMPEEFISVANQKLAAINDAYSQIEKEHLS